MSSGSSPFRSSNPGTYDPRGDWESSPMYQAISGRLAQNESALSVLSTQVAQLTSLVKAALPGTFPNPVFSPFEDPQSSGGLAAAAAQSSAGHSPSGSSDASSITALTQQISALSTSVAQLQRLQQSQAHASRQNSFTRPSLGATERYSNGGGITRPLHAEPRNLGGGGGNPSIPSGASAGSGRLQSPGPSMLNGPAQSLLNHQAGRDFSPPVRPHGSRAVSTASAATLGGGMPGLDTDKWGPPSFGLNTGSRDWSPGPAFGRPDPSNLTPGTQMNGQTTPGGYFQNTGPGTPGGAAGPPSGGPSNGNVITKWDQLNLKADLVRSIGKYGIGPPNKIQARVLPFMLKGSDVIAQAPPTQERIISYVVPALQLCLTVAPHTTYRGPTVVVITTTVDQAAQCHKLVRSIGAPLGIRSALATGAAGSSSLQDEIASMQHDNIHLLIGTPAKVNDVLTSRGALAGSHVRLLILDEVDQLIARNLYENVLSVAKVLPSPWRGGIGAAAVNAPVPTFSPGASLGMASPYDPGQHSPFNPASKTPFPNQQAAPPGVGSRFGAPGTTSGGAAAAPGAQAEIERQTCIFSNTIPTDVINFSQSLNVRDPVRVLVRREGGPNSQESVSSVTPGINLKHTYVYLTITGSARSDAPVQNEGPGAIGSGRNNVSANGPQAEEANRAKEYKLDTLVKMLEDYPLWQAVIHVGTFAMLEAVVYRLSNRQWETLYLSPDMPPPQKKAVLQNWRSSVAGSKGPRFLVIFDVVVKPPDIPWSPLVINFDLPRSVEGYAQRAAAALPPNGRNAGSVNGVIVSFVQAAGGDVEMLRSTECAYRFKSAEIPSVFHDLFQQH
ncbi:hypothetical protein BD324DRAFT_584377 [Kockovaella imperatae]|uniref:RNA helicase n=1 Tax=Kockovaella imperatae TaxID=4999 RepID=A0A1Y1U8H0_9TREE|nr:hypothetical protein BD324DRAFT_584377 [Kockovaella imperatae]ORX33834.1 hypothetical protein BD324DRAFT_584377 [Kockovaella imperatae]